MADENCKNNENYGYSLEYIVENNCFFKIPRYQRLFTWEEDQLLKLLNDIYESYKRNKECYYIGMLTSTYRQTKQESPYILVDGQQRITALTLVFIYVSNFSYHLKISVKDWLSFIKLSNTSQPRLFFCSRPEDNSLLTKLCNSENITFDFFVKDVLNNNDRHPFICAIESIKKWIEAFFEQKNDENLTDFINYIYTKTIFFISELPQNYNGNRLNEYFEAMNSTGLNLEQHEILKVLLINNLEDENNKRRWFKLWNQISDLDNLCFNFKSNEKNYEYRKRVCSYLFNKKIIFEKDSFSQPKANIDLNRPKKSEIDTSHRVENSKAIIPFQDLLLQVLFHILKKNNKEENVSLDSFFNTDHLLSTFDQFVLNRNSEKFIISPSDYLCELYFYRVALDSFYVSELTYNNEKEPNRYRLDFFSMDKAQCDIKDNLRMYELMLYVNYSSSVTYYVWFNDVMDFVDFYFKDEKKSKNSEIDKSDLAYRLFTYLKNEDNKRHKFPLFKDMTYQKIDRYWFWRLDFELWKNRKQFFEGKYLTIANNYVFKRNRSIEHVAPQNRRNEDIVDPQIYIEDKEGHKTLDDFGNLCMISSGLNSSLKNKSFSEKKGHVEAFFKDEKDSAVSIESLKLLMIYKIFEEQISRNRRMMWCQRKTRTVLL